ncbi:hypothetical protein CC80DRAFT_501271 [Byssothecium circinans]|uniref:Uncharacterized protein n=1 Tax=Byssothecium circinans TaxID=147558 RepID=A0A6A5U7Y7_9PLEO|nr:hypothetical protein CC80DRAFT_501271 [Byssothecium circinans]
MAATTPTAASDVGWAVLQKHYDQYNNYASADDFLDRDPRNEKVLYPDMRNIWKLAALAHRPAYKDKWLFWYNGLESVGRLRDNKNLIGKVSSGGLGGNGAPKAAMAYDFGGGQSQYHGENNFMTNAAGNAHGRKENKPPAPFFSSQSRHEHKEFKHAQRETERFALANGLIGMHSTPAFPFQLSPEDSAPVSKLTVFSSSIRRWTELGGESREDAGEVCENYGEETREAPEEREGQGCGQDSGARYVSPTIEAQGTQGERRASEMERGNVLDGEGPRRHGNEDTIYRFDMAYRMAWTDDTVTEW